MTNTLTESHPRSVPWRISCDCTPDTETGTHDHECSRVKALRALHSVGYTVHRLIRKETTDA